MKLCFPPVVCVSVRTYFSHHTNVLQVDRFVFDMYLLLCMVVCLHQVCNTLSNKIDVWPLRYFNETAIIRYFLTVPCLSILHMY